MPISRSLHVDSADAAPIWSQIEQGVRRLVASGSLGAGSPMPSVRDLARELRVNPATVSKAYQRLTEAGLLEVRRGDGTYVAAEPPSLSRSERRARHAGAGAALCGLRPDAGRHARRGGRRAEVGVGGAEPAGRGGER